MDIRVYRLNLQAVDEAYETLNQTTMKLTAMTDRKVEGTISVTEPGRLVLSIPADEGWKLQVDGKSAEVEPFKDAWIAVKLGAGKHRIFLSYTTPGLYVGALVSAAAIVLAIGSLGVGKIMKKRKSDG